jgi:hypothetical protein
MSKNDNRVKGLIKKLEDKKKSLGAKPKKAWETNALFKYTDGRVLNLNTIGSFDKAISGLTYLLNASKNHAEACKLLCVFDMFDWDGYSLEAWTEDFKLCVDKVKYAEEEKKYKALEKKLNSLVSKEARTGMELDDIEGLLK